MLEQPLHKMLLMHMALATMSIKHTLTPAGLSEQAPEIVTQWPHQITVSACTCLSDAGGGLEAEQPHLFCSCGAAHASLECISAH